MQFQYEDDIELEHHAPWILNKWNDQTSTTKELVCAKLHNASESIRESLAKGTRP